MISATIHGNIGSDAEFKVTAAGDKICSFSLASNEKRGGEEHVTWVRCSLWGNRAEKVAKHLTKGTRIFATGTLSLREYKKDGQTRQSLDMRVSEFDFLPSAKRDTASKDAENGDLPEAFR